MNWVETDQKGRFINMNMAICVTRRKVLKELKPTCVLARERYNNSLGYYDFGEYCSQVLEVSAAVYNRKATVEYQERLEEWEEAYLEYWEVGIADRIYKVSKNPLVDY